MLIGRRDIGEMEGRGQGARRLGGGGDRSRPKRLIDNATKEGIMFDL